MRPSPGLMPPVCARTQALPWTVGCHWEFGRDIPGLSKFSSTQDWGSAILGPLGFVPHSLSSDAFHAHTLTREPLGKAVLGLVLWFSLGSPSSFWGEKGAC